MLANPEMRSVVVKKALVNLAVRGDERVIAALCGLLEHNDSSVRVAVVEALAQLSNQGDRMC